jgi:hypothetical protein
MNVFAERLCKVRNYIHISAKHPKDIYMKMAIVMFAEALENRQHSMWVIPECEVILSNFNSEDLWARTSTKNNCVHTSG